MTVSMQFMPRQAYEDDKPRFHVGEHVSDVFGEHVQSGQERQPWKGESRLGAPQKGALNTRQRAYSLLGESGNPYSVPTPIMEGLFGSYGFKME